ncbi:Protein PLANT CADMIUM RESISTANCE 3 [Hibiscus syriacus]|uniref:Protein PLANT CADMIUM RESISTANCE 3 n=1 Tax=Hibiscus syriacus TaxID=106335 RepID=A0A6A2WZE4_HIBSY|nr:Protein PLANT CADMIUM RESISTANCE 3 [Hibiscus syriacus]
MVMYPTDQPPLQQCSAPSYQYGQPAPPPFAGLVTTSSQQYPMQNHYMHHAGKVLWSTGVCDCCYDIQNCIITMFCPCITFGQIAEIVDHGSIFIGASVSVLILLPHENEASIHVGRDTLPRLVHSYLLRAMRIVSRIPRAPKPWLRHVHRMGCEYGEVPTTGNANGSAAGGERWDEKIKEEEESGDHFLKC